GLGPVRSASYLMAGQSQWDYVQYANENVLLLPQIEDIAIVDELDEIVKMDGVDGFVIGPRDLAMSMGFYDGPAHKEAQQMVNHIIKTVVHSGKLCGTVASTAEQAQSLIDQGVKIIINSVQTIYISGIKNFIQSIKYK
ncbi:MAG TPA: aldolase/citrate lyase family protein, partial [Saprospiraceae bacterium]|nr:aldolase/citrate lyase family protein [Saprospiraceae bacterium]